LCFRVMLSPFISRLCSSEGCLMPKHELPCRYHDSIGIIRLIMRFVGHES
jgi:hypothetical protein